MKDKLFLDLGLLNYLWFWILCLNKKQQKVMTNGLKQGISEIRSKSLSEQTDDSSKCICYEKINILKIDTIISQMLTT